jgi:hypothetical protein
MPQPRIRVCGIWRFTSLCSCGSEVSRERRKRVGIGSLLLWSGLLAAFASASAANPAVHSNGPEGAREESGSPPPIGDIHQISNEDSDALGSDVWLSTGIRYNQNLSINPDRIEDESSPIAMTSLYGYDQRAILGWDLRSVGYADYEVDLLDKDRDYQDVSAQTGPVFHLGDGWDLYSSIGGGAAFFGYDFYSANGATYLRLENLDGSPVRAVELDVGYERTGDSFEGGDAPWVDIYATLGLDDIALEADWVEFTPLLEFNFSDEDVFAYGQLGATLEYGFPLADNLEIKTSLTSYRRVYDLAEDGPSPRRRDWFVLAQLDILYSGLFVDSLALEVTGSYEQNWSSYGNEEYKGGYASIVLHWIF